MNQHSSTALRDLNENELKPTLAFSDIMSNLNVLYEDLLIADSPRTSSRNGQKALKEARSLLKKIDHQIQLQANTNRGQSFETYLNHWVAEWETFKPKLQVHLGSGKNLGSILQSEASITDLLEKMRNIATFIQMDTADLLKESSKFSDKTILILALTLFLGLFIGVFSSVIILRSIRRLLLKITQTELQLIHSNKLASLGEMSAGIAHEINNPLSIILGSVEQLPKYIQDPQKFESKIQMIRRAGDRISRIIKGLKKFSHSSEQHSYSNHALSEIVTEAIVLTHTKSKENETEVHCDLKSQSLIYCDEGEIEQVLINLINNAVDAVKLYTEKWVKIEVFDQEQNVILRVTDAGPGIPEAIRLKLFQPFFTTKPVGEGTGLGLSITQGILKEHRATITILPDVPHTCFEIRFQRVEPKVPAPT